MKTKLMEEFIKWIPTATSEDLEQVSMWIMSELIERDIEEGEYDEHDTTDY